MEKERSSKLIVIIALVVAVAGLSFGFAAFTKDLNINFSESNVNVSGDLDVKIHAVVDIEKTNQIDFSSKVIEGFATDEKIETTSFTISDDGSKLTGGSVIFNNYDQVVLYPIAIKNYTEYDAYLNSIDFLNYEDSDSFNVCTALNGTTQSMVDVACDFIGVLVSDYGDFSVNSVFLSEFDPLEIKAGSEIFLSFSVVYAGPDIVKEFGVSEAAPLPDGDFKINFGDIKFNFSSIAANND